MIDKMTLAWFIVQRLKPDRLGEAAISERETNMQKLFLSYYSVARAVKENSVPQQDLELGLFVPSCTRPWVFTSWQTAKDHREVPHDIDVVCHDPTTRSDVLRRLIVIFAKAEQQDRVLWHKPLCFTNYALINGFLVRKGHASMMGLEGFDPGQPVNALPIDQCGLQLQHFLRMANIPLEVFTR